MAKKYYFIKSGRKVGLFSDWAEAEASVKGYTGALYCGFENEIAARAFAAADGDVDTAISLLQKAVKEVEQKTSLIAAPASAAASEPAPVTAPEVTPAPEVITAPEVASESAATPAFVPTPSQADFFKYALGKFLKNNETAILLIGNAGTGKTTSAKHVALSSGLPVFLMAYTNKAAGRGREVLGEDAECGTIHHYLYDYDEVSGKSILNAQGFPGHSLILVDECSMIYDDNAAGGLKMISDLLAIAKQKKSKIIFMGDPFQLPPVPQNVKTIWEFGLKTFYFTEIMRQKEESVIAMATSTRSIGRAVMIDTPNAVTTWGKVCQAPAAKLFEDYCKKYPVNKDTQIGLVWSNPTRIKMTKTCRQILGFADSIINVGEPVISIANSEKMANGDIALVESIEVEPKLVKLQLKGNAFKEGEILDCYVSKINNMPMLLIPATKQSSVYHASFEENSLRQLPGEFLEGSRFPKISNKVSIVTYGYFITVHKAQGGEWKRVYVFETPVLVQNIKETSWEEKAEFAARGYYTAITRTSDVLLLANELSDHKLRCAIKGTPQDMLDEMKKYYAK